METVRHYALDRAADAGELAVLRDAHAGWWIDELERIDARQPTWDVLDLLGRHLLDLHAALDWLEPDHRRRYTLLALVALGWSWGGHTDDVLYYVDRWVTPDGIDRSVHWARAFCASMMAMFSGMRAHLHIVGEAFELVAAASDGRAALAVAGALIAEPDEAPRRFATAMDLAIDDDCDVHLASFGAIVSGYLATEVPDDARRYATVIDAAIARGRCPNRAVRLCDVAEPPNAVPRCANRLADVELRVDDLFLVDRVLYVAYLLSSALIHGRTDQFDANLGFLARYPHFPIARSTLDALSAVRKVIDGDDLAEHELQSLTNYSADAPIHIRLSGARAAVSSGGRHLTRRLTDELRRGRAGETADALMQAVLALHDDRVLDAGRLVTQAMSAEADFVWIELQPDLLEIAAVVASRCDDHERALILLAAAESARTATGVRFRFRDQQQWVDDLRERAATRPDSDTADEPVARSTAMSTADALAYPRRGSGERKRPASGWDALSPTELQVAHLVAHGLTNPQIAQRLLISRATVKTHVSHCLTKLGMATRSEIAAETARRGD